VNAGAGQLVVNGPHDFTALRVLDAQLSEVSSAIGSLQATLPAGLYEVQASHPGRAQRRVVAVRAGGVASLDDLDDTLSRPLASLADPTVGSAVAVATRRAVPWRGSARLILCAEGAYQDADGMRLVCAEGSTVVDNHPTTWSVYGGVRVASADLPAGGYALEHDIPGMGPRACAVWLQPDFETQVFIATRDPIDPIRAIHMRPIGSGYQADQPASYARVRAAVEGLLVGELVVPASLLSSLTSGEADDPILLLVAAHAARICRALSDVELERAARTIARALPGSPDALVLELLTVLEHGEVAPLRAPPMLAAATEELMLIAAQRPAVVEADSWLQDISQRLTSWGAWTRWQVQTAPRLVEATTRRQVADVAREMPGGGIGDIARTLGLPQSVIADFEATIKAARARWPGRVWGKVRLVAAEVWAVVRDVVLAVATLVARGMRAAWRAYIAPRHREADRVRRSLQQTSLPPAAQRYVHARLLPLIDWTETQAWKAQRLLLASRTAAVLAAVLIIPVVALIPGAKGWAWAAAGLGVLVAAATVVRSQLSLDTQAEREFARLFELTKVAQDFVVAANAPENASGEALTALVTRVEAVADSVYPWVGGSLTAPREGLVIAARAPAADPRGNWTTEPDVTSTAMPVAETMANAPPLADAASIATSRPWREEALARLAEQRFVLSWLLARPPSGRPVSQPELAVIEDHWAAAASGALQRSRRGAVVERVTSHLDAVEQELLRLAPDEYVYGQLPGIIWHVQHTLAADDYRRQRVEAVARRVEDGALPTPLDGDREIIIAAKHVANAQSRRQVTRLRSFRNVIVMTAIVLAVGALALALVGILAPEKLPTCFASDGQIACPTSTAPLTASQTTGSHAAAAIDEAIRATASSWDIPLMELVGALAAAVAAAVSLRRVRGTSTPYNLPVALALLKLPAGALTAALGVLLMRGAFIPGLTSLDSSGQIIAWAVVLGYSQQLITRYADQAAVAVLADTAYSSADSAATVSGREPDTVRLQEAIRQ
jgi:hypothetical protein